MTNFSTSDDIRDRYVALLGKSLGEVHHAVWNDLAGLHVKWGQFSALFGETPERVDILNSAAPLFFRIVQDVLWDDTLLHIARLTDAPKIGSRTNLSIRCYPELITEPGNRARIEALVDTAIQASVFARDWRNRRIAHNDFQLMVNQQTQPLAVASRLSVKGALAAIAEVFNEVERSYFNSETAFDGMYEPGDAAAMLYVLREGLEAQRKRRERHERGDFIDEDLAPLRPI